MIDAKAFEELVTDIFSADGLLSYSKNFEYRREQQAMAVGIARQLISGGTLCVEAGTGVGKSLAYLIPSALFAMESGRKAILSTHTINLQEQLVNKDIPLLIKLLEKGELFTRPLRFALLKGRSNYLCPLRLDRAFRQREELFSPQERKLFYKLYDWAEDAEQGTRSEVPFYIPDKVWQSVCSESSVCTPRVCGKKGDCFYQKARKDSEEADILVVNHTLFFSLLASHGEGGETGFLYEDDFVIFDEAHTLESVASSQLGVSQNHAALRFFLQRLSHNQTGKGILSPLSHAEGIRAVGEAQSDVEAFFSELSKQVVFEGASRECRLSQALEIENQLTPRLFALAGLLDDYAQDTPREEFMLKGELQEASRSAEKIAESLQRFCAWQEEESVYWVEKTARDNLSIHVTPINIAQLLSTVLFSPQKTSILTSATLGIGEADLGYFRNRIGARYAKSMRIGSPFDYTKQMEIFVIKSMPEPAQDGYKEALIYWIERVIRFSQGRAFVLFTNYKLMGEVAESMEDFFSENGWRLLVQGTGMERHRMIEVFRKDIHSVLFGTDSFWTGIDVPGEALSNVVITRLPFAVPDHPVIAAKMEALEAEGKNPFMEYSLPEAVLKLRQGVGRLIRSEKDKGMVVLLDKRIITKFYGKNFIRALPPAPIKSYGKES